MIYIDFGCHNGDSVIDFHEGRFGNINPAGVRSIAIDPISGFEEKWKGIAERFGTEFHQFAIFTHNGDIDFSEMDVSSTVMREKTKYETGKRRKVQAVDIEKFLEPFADKEIVARMDIEGAEYPVLQKIMDLDLLRKFLYIEVEFHSSKLGEGYKKIENRIIKSLRTSGVGFKEITH